MEVDAALYAGIAKRIAINNNWIELIGDGKDWLDKPHLPFWITALSFKCFGVNDFAVKLPALLSLLLSVKYCYLLALQHGSRTTAQYSCIILLTSLHLYLSLFDVRAEAYLILFVTAAIYHYHRLFQQPKFSQAIAAALFTAAAICTKGIFTAITIYAGFGIYWMISKEWHFLWNRWLWISIALTGIFILPELICLYLQFDAHPEKIVFGQPGVSGIRFFFWDSQFGRFFNNGPIKGSGDLFFFVHTLLWAMIPWSIVVFPAWISTSIKAYKERDSFLVLSGTALASFCLFSFSHFQLPHYIVIIFPLYAIFIAHYLYSLKTATAHWRWTLVQLAVLIICILAIVSISLLSGFTKWWLLGILFAACVAVLFYAQRFAIKLYWPLAICTALLLFSYLALVFYPKLLPYQGGQAAAAWLNSNQPQTAPYFYKTGSYSFEWKLNNPVKRLEASSALREVLLRNKQVTIYTYQDRLPPSDTYSIRILHRFGHYPITQLSIDFLQQQHRSKVLDTVCLAEISLKPLDH
jgi:4-amino-4-deoxy-L-arabinose transferase-like glycosyltransferase